MSLKCASGMIWKLFDSTCTTSEKLEQLYYMFGLFLALDHLWSTQAWPRASQSCLRPNCIAVCINALSNQAIKINQNSIHPHLQLNLGSFPVSSEVPKWIKPRHKKPGMRIKSSFSSSKRRFHAATPAWRNSWRDRRTAVGYQSILLQHG